MTGLRLFLAGCSVLGNEVVHTFKNKQSVLPLFGACKHSGAGVRAELVPVVLVSGVE